MAKKNKKQKRPHAHGKSPKKPGGHNSTGLPATSPKQSTATPRKPSEAWIWVLRAMLVLATLIAAWLANASLSGGSVAGCGAGSNCDVVLQSRWSSWFGVPVSIPAMLVYLAMLTGSFQIGTASLSKQRAAWSGLTCGAIVLIGAATWFVGLQVVVIKSFCWFCLTAHGLGLVSGILILTKLPHRIETGTGSAPLPFGPSQRTRMAVAGFVLLVPLIGGQLLVAPKSFEVGAGGQSAIVESNTDTPTPESASIRSAPEVVEPEPSRVLTTHDGQFEFEVNAVPLIGSPDAQHFILSLFDYTCSHCREQHELLVQAQRRHSEDLAIVTLPFPLDATCNPLLNRTGSDHINACQYARIGMAVWRQNRSVFEQYEHWFFESPRPRPLEEVMAKAVEMTGADDFSTALSDPWIEAWLQKSMQIFRENRRRTGSTLLPQLVIGDQIVAGVIRSELQLAELLKTHLGLESGI